MLLTLLIGLLACAFLAFFLHLFFQLNRSERRLQSMLMNVEASMLQRYGRPKAQSAEHDDHDKKNKKA